MADKDFVVKNGLQVNGGLWVINSTAFYHNNAPFLTANNYAGRANTANTASTANNSLYLGEVPANNYITTLNNYTISGNLAFTGANVIFNSVKVGSNVVVNSSAFFVGNSSVNVAITSQGLAVNGVLQTGSGGYYKGNRGSFGESQNANNLYRINSQTQTNNITIASGESSLTVGPMVIANGFNLVVEPGGRAVII